MIKSKYIGFEILIIALIGIIFISGYIQQMKPKPVYSDVEIVDFKWEKFWNPGDDDCNRPPIYYTHYYTQEGLNEGLKGNGNLIIRSLKEDLNVWIWVNGKSKIDYPRPLQVGDNRIYLNDIYLNSLYGEITFKVCFSDEIEYSTNAICKEKSFSMPKISVSVSPDPLKFTVKKEDIKYPRKTIKITNTGDIPLDVYVLLPSYVVDSLNYPKYYPQYPTFGFTDWPDHFPNWPKEEAKGGTFTTVNLLPGESATYDVGLIIGNVEEFDTPPGTYTSTGYVFSFYNKFDLAPFKKEFTIITTVE